MKKRLLKRIAYVVAIMLLPFNAIIGQNVIFEVPGTVSINSLIREYERGEHIVYNNNGTGSFFFINEFVVPSPTATEAVIPNLQSVSDMEIVGNTLYFCGVCSNNQVIGRFDIPSVFFGGTGQVEMVFVNYNPVVNGYTGSLTLNKIEIQEIATNDIHVYAIGDVKFGAPGSIPPDYTVLFDAMYNGLTWNFEDIYDPNGDYCFYDLAVTTNYLVVFGEKYNGQKEYYNYFPIAYPGNNHLTSTPIFYMYADLSSFFPISRTLVEALSNDEFVTACYGSLGGDSGVVITRYQYPYTSLGRWFFPDITLSKSFRDLKYSRKDSVLYLMPEMTRSSFPDLMYVFNVSRGSAQVYQSSIPQLCSVDRLHTNNGATACGITQAGEIAVWSTRKADCQCAKSISLAVAKHNHSIDDWQLHASINTFTCYSSWSTPSINTFTLDETCRNNYKSDEEIEEE